jgi:lysophospholipase L1-like esterase
MRFGCVVLALLPAATAFAQPRPAPNFNLTLDCGSEKPAAGHMSLMPGDTYSREPGYGIEPGAAVQALHRSGDLLAGSGSFQVSIAVPEGNYQVTVKLGDPEAPSETTVKAEIRRLMVENAKLEKGETRVCTFNVNVRTPEIPGGGAVRLKPRERQGEIHAWDDKLTLEFDGKYPCVSTITVKSLENVPVVYVCGDSTVCDQPGENYASWGQMLPRFFNTGVVIANHGESGESLRGFLGEKRWDKVMSLIKPGDYMILQMGHNDEKEKGEGIGPLTSFKTDLMRFVDDTRARGATPILVSPMERRSFDANGRARETHGQYPQAYREVAKGSKVAYIDLTASSAVLYNALGPDKAYLAFAGTGTNRDATHHDNYGAYELAKVVVQGIRDNKVDLAKYIAGDFHGFDPAKPDPVDTFYIPSGASRNNAVPLGN